MKYKMQHTMLNLKKIKIFFWKFWCQIYAAPYPAYTDAAYAPAEHCCQSPAPPAAELYCIWPTAATTTTRGGKNDTGAPLHQDNLIVRADLFPF